MVVMCFRILRLLLLVFLFYGSCVLVGSKPVKDCPTSSSVAVYIVDDVNPCVYYLCHGGKEVPLACTPGTITPWYPVLGHKNPCTHRSSKCTGNIPRRLLTTESSGNRAGAVGVTAAFGIVTSTPGLITQSTPRSHTYSPEQGNYTKEEFHTKHQLNSSKEHKVDYSSPFQGIAETIVELIPKHRGQKTTPDCSKCSMFNCLLLCFATSGCAGVDYDFQNDLCFMYTISNVCGELQPAFRVSHYRRVHCAGNTAIVVPVHHTDGQVFDTYLQSEPFWPSSKNTSLMFSATFKNKTYARIKPTSSSEKEEENSQRLVGYQSNTASRHKQNTESEQPPNSSLSNPSQNAQNGPKPGQNTQKQSGNFPHRNISSSKGGYQNSRFKTKGQSLTRAAKGRKKYAATNLRKTVLKSETDNKESSSEQQVKEFYVSLTQNRDKSMEAPQKQSKHSGISAPETEIANEKPEPLKKEKTQRALRQLSLHSNPQLYSAKSYHDADSKAENGLLRKHQSASRRKLTQRHYSGSTNENSNHYSSAHFTGRSRYAKSHAKTKYDSSQKDTLSSSSEDERETKTTKLRHLPKEIQTLQDSLAHANLFYHLSRDDINERPQQTLHELTNQDRQMPDEETYHDGHHSPSRLKSYKTKQTEKDAGTSEKSDASPVERKQAIKSEDVKEGAHYKSRYLDGANKQEDTATGKYLYRMMFKEDNDVDTRKKRAHEGYVTQDEAEDEVKRGDGRDHYKLQYRSLFSQVGGDENSEDPGRRDPPSATHYHTHANTGHVSDRRGGKTYSEKDRYRGSYNDDTSLDADVKGSYGDDDTEDEEKKDVDDDDDDDDDDNDDRHYENSVDQSNPHYRSDRGRHSSNEDGKRLFLRSRKDGHPKDRDATRGKTRVKTKSSYISSRSYHRESNLKGLLKNIRPLRTQYEESLEEKDGEMATLYRRRTLKKTPASSEDEEDESVSFGQDDEKKRSEGYHRLINREKKKNALLVDFFKKFLTQYKEELAVIEDGLSGQDLAELTEVITTVTSDLPSVPDPRLHLTRPLLSSSRYREVPTDGPERLRGSYARSGTSVYLPNDGKFVVTDDDMDPPSSLPETWLAYPGKSVRHAAAIVKVKSGDECFEFCLDQGPEKCAAVDFNVAFGRCFIHRADSACGPLRDDSAVYHAKVKPCPSPYPRPMDYSRAQKARLSSRKDEP